jgi:hypothetical protein
MKIALTLVVAILAGCASKPKPAFNPIPPPTPHPLIVDGVGVPGSYPPPNTDIKPRRKLPRFPLHEQRTIQR